MAALRPLFRLSAAMVLSLLVYFAASATVLRRPVTYDSITRMMERKVAYGKRQPSPKLVLIGGSGVRTSHRCDVFAAQLGWPCVNGGATVGLSLRYTFDTYKAFLKPGDVIYLPLEYQQYLMSRAETFTGPDAAILFRSDWHQLISRGPEGFVRAAFMADIEFVGQSLIEQMLAAGGVRARFDKQESNAYGDQTGLTHQAGRGYDSFIKTTRWRPPSVEAFEQARGAKQDIAAFLDWCRANGIRVIGGLPVAFDDRPIPEPLVASIRAFFAAHGARMIVLDNRSQYPRDYFYDTPFHLEEEHALEHSHRLVPYLRAALPPPPNEAPGQRYLGVSA